jgi:predicted enzyme related to lactoylglutathione lyase
MPNPVVHFEIISKDATSLRSFYHEAFGWSIGPEQGGSSVPSYTIVHPDARGIEGGIGETPDGYDGHVTFYVGVPDIAAAFATIERLGGTRLMGPDPVPGGPVIGLFRDPQGHTVGLVEAN